MDVFLFLGISRGITVMPSTPGSSIGTFSARSFSWIYARSDFLCSL